MSEVPSFRPVGYHTVTPSIVVHDAPAAIAFYVKGLGARERSRDLGPGGKVWHAEIQIGDSIVMLSDEFPEMGSRSAKTLGDAPGSLWLYVPDVDEVYRKALHAGATSVREPSDEFWGDRLAMIEDPFGHTWAIASRRENVTPEEIGRRRRAAMDSFTGGKS
jgi:PhnB protein